MTYSARRLSVSKILLVPALAIYLLLIPLDGLIRVIALRTHSYLLNAWKDCLLLVLLSVGAIVSLLHARVRGQSGGVFAPFLTVSVFGVALLGVFHGLVNQTTIVPQALWGLKVLYLPILLFVLVQLMPGDVGPAFCQKIVNGLLWFSIPICLFGIWQFFMGWNFVTALFVGDATESIGYVNIAKMGGFLRAFSTLREPFAFGDFCSMLLMYDLALMLFSRKRWWHWPVALLLLAGIIVSTSRVSIITAVAGAITLFLCRKRHAGVLYFGMAFVGLIVVMAAASTVMMGADLARGRDGFLGALLASGSLFGRTLEWSSVLARYPMNSIMKILMGWGTGAIGSAQAKVSAEYFFVDNFYLLILILHGLIGCAVWFGLLLKCFVALINFVTRYASRTTAGYWFIAGTAAFVGSQFVEFLFRTGLEGFPGQIFFWTFLGLSLRLIQEVRADTFHMPPFSVPAHSGYGERRLGAETFVDQPLRVDRNG